jgi:glycosyltransferase involved in cell wall biosynthesis
MHVAQISFFNDPEGRAPARLLEAWPSLVDVADAAASAGVRVSVLQASIHTHRLTRHEVPYHFLPFGRAPGAEVHRAELAELLQALAPDVFHVHGLGFVRDVPLLARLAPHTPILLQDHADRAPPLWRRGSWRAGFGAASAVMFCAREQAAPFGRAGLVHARMKVFEVPESTSRFAPGDRLRARRVTALQGDPAVLWVGHLDENKDPLTVLDGIRAAARELPRLQLHCCFGTAPLLHAVEERIARDRALRPRVRLLGRVPHERVQQLMRAADLFVLGSHREGSGYSLIEALACGLPPVVTDIPSFRALTAGTVGRLWAPRDAAALSAAVRSIAPGLGETTREQVRAHFERELSLPALGRKLAAAYAEVIEHHGIAQAESAVRVRDGTAGT